MRNIAKTWTVRPGGFDPLHALEIYPAAGPNGIPQLPRCEHVPENMHPYTEWRRRKRGKRLQMVGAAHFFLEDYRFEGVWTSPQRALRYCEGSSAMLTPDFSVYPDHPRAVQLWNTYRSRWVGAAWAAAGATVIPSVSWADAGSFTFCFEGLPIGGVHAVSVVGSTGRGETSDVAKGFAAGFEEFLGRCKPDFLLLYGERLPCDARGVEIRKYTPWQRNLRALDGRA